MGTDRFLSKELTEEQKMIIDVIRGTFRLMFNTLDEHIPEGREKSLYITKLEEACMWAVKAVSREKTDGNV